MAVLCILCLRGRHPVFNRRHDRFVGWKTGCDRRAENRLRRWRTGPVFHYVIVQTVSTDPLENLLYCSFRELFFAMYLKLSRDSGVPMVLDIVLRPDEVCRSEYRLPEALQAYETTTHRPSILLAISDHLFPCCLCNPMSSASSSSVHSDFFKRWSRWFVHRSRHCLPVLPGRACAILVHLLPNMA